MKPDDKAKECIFIGYGYEEFWYSLWDPMAKKLIRSRDVMFLKNQIVGYEEKSDKPQSSPETPILLTLVSLLTVHNDHRRAGQDNDDGSVEQVEQAPQELPTLLVEPELRRSTWERHLSTRYLIHEYVILTDGREVECFEEAMSYQSKNEWVKSMHEKMKSLNDNCIYDLVKLHKEKRHWKKKWAYRLKAENNL